MKNNIHIKNNNERKHREIERRQEKGKKLKEKKSTRKEKTGKKKKEEEQTRKKLTSFSHLTGF
jgi:hypothetical protein